MDNNESSDYQQIFLHDRPLLDVRAPIEFSQGAFPLATNIPLMSDQEREAVGICYKRKGKQAALALGYKLVDGEVRQQRLQAWLDFVRHNPQGYVYCLRGGLRSHIVQQWLNDAGVDYSLVKGGYKKLRNFLLSIIDGVAQMPMFVVSGNTGSGKTRLINQLTQGIDLEGLAYHRGSSFGRTFIPQSTQIDFENRLAISLLKQQNKCLIEHWVIEDESRSIGVNHVPLPIYNTMTQSPVVVIDDPFDLRLQRLQQEYIDAMCSGFQQRYGEEQGWLKFADYLQQGLDGIQKRLGSERYHNLSVSLKQALQQHQATNKSDGHLNWLAPLLRNYYDPMYTYQLDKKQQRIIFRGNFLAVLDYLTQVRND